MLQKDHHTTHHVPVLLSEVLDVLSVQTGESYLDATAGYGGHARAVLELTHNPKESVLVDRDENAVRHLQEQFGSSGTEIIHNDFYHAAVQLTQANRQFDAILADLGVSSPHLDNASRGFAFSTPGPLDMRMDQSQGMTAEDLVNTAPAEELARILWEYGEERRSRTIASAIIAARPIKSTDQLAAVIERAIGRKPGTRVHPATRSFQAIRIAVNDELGLLERTLPLWVDLLKPGGRLAVISFHSLEDRIIKQFFNERAGNRYDAELRDLTRRPLMAGSNELVSNPRARSAKLRAVVKIKIQGEPHAYPGKK